jgi:hypothetical protein
MKDFQSKIQQNLQPSRVNIACKNMKFIIFLFAGHYFFPSLKLGPDQESNSGYKGPI